MKEELRSAVAGGYGGQESIAVPVAVMEDLSRRRSAAKMDSGAKQVRKSENSHFSRILAIFPLEPAAVQSIPTEAEPEDFSDFQRNSQAVIYGGRGARD
jgi:hypothetical protein